MSAEVKKTTYAKASVDKGGGDQQKVEPNLGVTGKNLYLEGLLWTKDGPEALLSGR